MTTSVYAIYQRGRNKSCNVRQRETVDSTNAGMEMLQCHMEEYSKPVNGSTYQALPLLLGQHAHGEI